MHFENFAIDVIIIYWLGDPLEPFQQMRVGEKTGNELWGCELAISNYIFYLYFSPK